MKIAIIDLGTNTCNLLIAELNNSTYKILFQGKEHVKLLTKKAGENWISDGGYSRTALALENHLRKIKHYSVKEIQLIATSAVRDAANRDEFVEFIQIKTGLKTTVITGSREAELIYNGVLLAFGKIETPSLILDIGGGSNELIISNGLEKIWEESIPAGMSRIINLFQISDPISPKEIVELNRFFQIQNNEATTIGKTTGVKILIGCSGAFDTIADMIDKVGPGTKKRIRQTIEIKDFNKTYQKLIKSSREERLLIKGMDEVRIDLIVPAVVLIKQIITELGIEKILQTDFALREGILYERLNF